MNKTKGYGMFYFVDEDGKEQFRKINNRQRKRILTYCNSNSHGAITASGTFGNEFPWKAFNGTRNGGTSPDCDNWSVNSKTGWLELKLDYPIYVTSIEIWNGVSSSSNRTKAAYFTGAGGTALGSSFELTNSNYAYKQVNVGGLWTNIIRLNITSSYGSYVGAGMIKINATV